jgi:hypothetical protein
MDITDTEITAFARNLISDLHRSYPRLIEQEVLVEAATGVGIDPEEPLKALKEARLLVIAEIETSLRLWLAAHDVPVAELAELTELSDEPIPNSKARGSR